MPNLTNKRYIADEIMGEKGEVFSHSLLEKLFGKLERTKYKYDRFDYTNEKFIIELKTRSCNHNAFDRDKGLMFNYSKIEKMITTNDVRDTYFAFNCKDGIYCWKYDDEKFSRGIGGRKDRGCVEMREMAYVLSKDMVCLYEKPKPYFLDSSDEED